MSRLDRALKRRDIEAGRIAVPDSDVDVLPSSSPSDDSRIVSTRLLDHFPLEPGVAHEARPRPVTKTFESGWRREAPPAPELVSTTEAFKALSPKIAGKVVGSVGMDPRPAEQYRRLAAALHQTQVERGIKKVMVASAVAAEGKTLTALNLALTLSESYLKRVVLVDADLRCPGVHQLLDLPDATGLNELLKDVHPSALTLTAVSSKLSILPAGHAEPDPMGQLTSARMASILAELAQKFDWVIVDTPPVVLFPDANLLAAMVDGAVLVIRSGQTPHDVVDRAIQTLGRKRILGLVLNRAEETETQYPASAYRR